MLGALRLYTTSLLYTFYLSPVYVKMELREYDLIQHTNMATYGG